MLARPLSNISDIKTQVLKFGDKCLVESKLDGERIQVNYNRSREKGDRLKLFSRNLESQNRKYFKVARELETILDEISVSS